MKQLDRYAQLKIEIAQREAELDKLKPEVISFIQEKSVEEVKHDAGTFTLQQRRTYKYPEEITATEAKLKEDKKTAEQLGTASYIEKPVLVFKPNVQD